MLGGLYLPQYIAMPQLTRIQRGKYTERLTTVKMSEAMCEPGIKIIAGCEGTFMNLSSVLLPRRVEESESEDPAPFHNRTMSGWCNQH
ncbi:hypothetical protein ACTXT7_004582 [Hymenolepis weldensis]